MIDLSLNQMCHVLSPLAQSRARLRDFVRASAEQTRRVMGPLLRPGQAQCGDEACADDDCGARPRAGVRSHDL